MNFIDVITREVRGREKAQDGNPEQSKLPTDTRRPLRVGMMVLVIGFGGFLLWASTVPLSSGVPAAGTIVLDGRRKAIQHFSGGVVKEILVREGQAVNEGDLLIRMDDSVALANRSSASSQLKSVEIQIQFLDKLVSDLQALSAEGFYPKNRFIEIQKQLADAQGQKAALNDRVAAADSELKRARITATSTGKVMGLSITTEGGVIPPGAKVLEIVPDDEKLVVETQIQPHLIDRVTPGLSAEVRFSTTYARKTPVIVGQVEWVSADKFKDPQDPTSPMGYYTARLTISAEEMKKMPDLDVRPGMIADVIVLTGSRTFLNYLFKPLTDSMAVSIKEH